MVWLTGFVNIYNFMDGTNGVAASMAAVSGGWFAYVGDDRGVEALTFLRRQAQGMDDPEELAEVLDRLAKVSDSPEEQRDRMRSMRYALPCRCANGSLN